MSFDEKIEKLKFDDGTKYTIWKFKKLCEKPRIRHQLIIPYTPQQNIVYERKNKTIMEMRCFLFEKVLSKTFWVKAINTSTCLMNMLLIKELSGKRPFEACYRRKLSMKHIKIVGNVCGIFLGYFSNGKGCMTYNPLT